MNTKLGAWAQSILDSFREDSGLVIDSRELTFRTDDKPWQLYEHEEYADAAREWDYTEAHYSARVVHRLNDFLHKRTGAESDERFGERKKAAGYPQLLAKTVDSFVGTLSTFEDETVLTTSEEPEAAGPLGTVDDEESLLGRFAQNVDGDGTNLEMWRLATATELAKYGEVWVLTDGVQRNDQGDTVSEPRFLTFPPQSVTNHLKDPTGRIVEVMLRTREDRRGSLADPPVSVPKYTWYTLDGAQDFFIRKKDGKWEVEVGPFFPYTFYEKKDRNSRRILPIFRGKLALKCNPAFMAAIENNVIFNQMSERDFLLRMAALMRFAIVASDDAQFKDIIANLQKFGVIQHYPEHQQEHYFIQPLVDAATALDEVIERRIGQFKEQTMQAFGDAVMKTATEIRGESKSGLEAYLEHLAGGLTEIDNGALWRFEQISFPDSRDNWGLAKVQRPQRFSALTTDDEMDDMMDRLFPTGEPLPAGPAARGEAMARYLRRRNLPVESTQIAQEIRALLEARSQENDALRQSGLFDDITL